MYDLNCQVWPVVKTATSRDQYSGRKFAVLSTSVKRRRFPLLLLLLVLVDWDDEPVPVPETDDADSGRWISRIFGDVDMLRVGWSGGTKTPSWRKDLTLVMRINDDADGERRMMGFEWPPCFFGMGRPADGVGTRGVFPPETCLALLLTLLPVAPWPGLVRLRPRKVSAVLRT